MSTTTTTVRKPRATKAFKQLLDFLGSDAAAVAQWNKVHPDNQIPVEGTTTVVAADPLTPEARALVEAGLITEEDALAVIGGAPAATEAPAAPPAPATSKDLGDVLVAEQGFVFSKGRVYTTPTLIEAQVRVFKTGKPEIVDVEGSRRTKGVLVFRTDDGASVALQNLGITEG